MSIDILHIIKRILLSDQTVSVPGLGVFYLKRIPAQVDKIRNDFYPPSAEIQFKLKPETRGDRLVQALIDEFGLDKQAALQSIRDYVDNIRDRFESGQSVNLVGLGNIYKDENDNLIFNGEEADPVFVASSYPAYSLEPVIRKSKADIDNIQKRLDSKVPIVQKEEKRSNVGVQKILPALIIGLLAVGMMGVYQWTKANSDVPTVELMSIDENRLNKKPIIDTHVSVIDDNLDEISNMEEPVQDEAVVEGAIEDKATEHIISDEKIEPEPIVEEKPIEIIKEDKTIKSEDSGDCIIIVGAFGSTANVSKMLGKIERLGMIGYQDSQLSRLTRVGVKANCNSVNESLQQVKNQIEPTAWILE